MTSNRADALDSQEPSGLNSVDDIGATGSHDLRCVFCNDIAGTYNFENYPLCHQHAIEIGNALIDGYVPMVLRVPNVPITT